MISRRNAMGGAAMIPLIKDDLVERYARALYEAYAPAGEGTTGSTSTSSVKWENASQTEQSFGREYALQVLSRLGLL